MAKVRKSSKKARRTVGVCVFSAHPLVGRQCQRLLDSTTIRFRAHNLPLYPGWSPTAVPRARVYIVDANPASQNAKTLVSAIGKQRPKGRTLILGENFSDANIFPFLQLGIKGLLQYEELHGHLARAVNLIAAGGYWVPRQLLSRFVEWTVATQSSLPASAPYLSSRERQVLDALMQNRSNKEIAAKLNIAERTVKFHVSNVLSKFGVRRRADLILMCFQENRNQAAED